MRITVIYEFAEGFVLMTPFVNILTERMKVILWTNHRWLISSQLFRSV